MGALFLNTIPLFPAIEITSIFYRPRNLMPSSLLDQYPHHDFLSPNLRAFATACAMGSPMIEILEDIATIAGIGCENIYEAYLPPSLARLVEIRDVSVHCTISMAPDGIEGDDEYAAGECLRLAALIFTLDRLFLPALPPAYYRVTQMLTERLNAAIGHGNSAPLWASHSLVLMWICFVGSTSQRIDVPARESLIRTAASLCDRLFSSQREMVAELSGVLMKVMGKADLYDEGIVDAFAAEVLQQYGTQSSRWSG